MDGNCPLKHGLADGVYFWELQGSTGLKGYLWQSTGPGLASDSTSSSLSGCISAGSGPRRKWFESRHYITIMTEARPK